MVTRRVLAASRSSRFFLAVGIFCAITICIYLDQLISKDSLLGHANDIEYQYFQLRSFLFGQLLKHHSLPLWNPFVFSGTPFLANIQTTIFYPPTACVLLFSPSFGITLSLVLHHILGGSFAYLLCRSFSMSVPGSVLGGVVYSFFPGLFRSAIFFGGLSSPQTIAWIPLILWAFKKAMDTGDIRYSILTGGAIAVHNLAGTPEIALGTNVGFLCFAILYSLPLISKRAYPILKKRAAYLALALIVGYSLPALQILPTMEFASLSNRAGGVSMETTGARSLNPMTLLAFIVMPGSSLAGSLGIPVAVGNLTSVLFILMGLFTIRPVFLRSYRIFWVILVFSFLISLGIYTPLYPLLHHFPVFTYFRNPGLLAVMGLPYISLITAAGLDRTLSSVKGSRKMARSARRIYASVLVLSVVTAIPVYAMGYRPVAEGLLSWSAGAALLLIVLFWRPLSRGKTPRGPWIILFFLCLDIILFSRLFVSPNLLPSYLESVRTTLDYLLPRTKEPFRIMAVNGVRIAPNDFTVLGLQSADGYDPLIVKKYAEFITRAVAPSGVPLDDLSVIHLENYSSRLADFLNIRYILSKDDLKAPKLTLRHSGAFRLYENTSALPRAFMVANVVFKKNEEILPYMSSPGFDPRREAVVEEGLADKIRPPGLASPPRPRGLTSQVRFTSYRPNDISLSVDADAEGLLVISDVYYPGWHALVDGQEQPIHEVNYCFRGIALTHGRHEITLYFRSRYFTLGLGISLFGLIMCMIVLMKSDYLSSLITP